MGRCFGSFSRSVSLPENANAEGVSAEYKNGGMIFTIPKITSPSLIQKQSTKIAVK